VPGLRPPALRSPSFAVHATSGARAQGQRRVHRAAVPGTPSRSPPLRRRGCVVAKCRHRRRRQRPRAVAENASSTGGPEETGRRGPQASSPSIGDRIGSKADFERASDGKYSGVAPALSVPGWFNDGANFCSSTRPALDAQRHRHWCRCITGMRARHRAGLKSDAAAPTGLTDWAPAWRFCERLFYAALDSDLRAGRMRTVLNGKIVTEVEARSSDSRAGADMKMGTNSEFQITPNASNNRKLKKESYP
jgi:hypothetical protein